MKFGPQTTLTHAEVDFYLSVTLFPSQELAESPLAGAVWESTAAAELRRQLVNAGWTGELFYWRDHGREVDFVLHRSDWVPPSSCSP